MMASSGPIVVSICGSSGAGKSQLAKVVVAALGDDDCARIPGDNFLMSANEPLDAFLARPLQYDWQLILRALREPIGTVGSIPRFNFDTMTRLSECGGNPFVVRRIMVIDAMYPCPAADLKVLLTAPEDVRQARIVERDSRWGARVIERWDNLEITRRHGEALSQSCDLVLDGTHSLDDNAASITQIVARFSEPSRNR